jgi:ParB family transcriptional regulator, chromosome partitioning protein
MTSGTFHIVSLGNITVKRDERQRRELSDIETLADSIRRLGLIHPIVVTRDLELVAGERRYAAIASLGWVTVPVQYVDELDPWRLREIELEENIKRQDITWTDQVNAVREYHEIRSRDADWDREKTGEALGLSRRNINRYLDIAEEMERGNKMVLNAPKLSTAAGIVNRANARREAQILEGLHSSLGGGPIETPPIENILNTDFTRWIHEELVTPRFNFLHCDFPYGIEADSFNQGSAVSHGGYTDTKETWDKLMEALAVATRHICAQSCHLMFWFALRKGDTRLYEPTAQALERMGWDINPQPLIWMKSDGMGILPDPERGPRQIYETCFLGSKGDRKIVRSVSNAYAAPTVRDKHMSEKPEPMLRYFFGMLVDENTVLLDPTCGSGSALRAAESLGARYTLGLEINEEFTDLARNALKNFRTLRAAQTTVG